MFRPCLVPPVQRPVGRIALHPITAINREPARIVATLLLDGNLRRVLRAGACLELASGDWVRGRRGAWRPAFPDSLARSSTAALATIGEWALRLDPLRLPRCAFSVAPRELPHLAAITQERRRDIRLDRRIDAGGKPRIDAGETELFREE